MKNIIMWAYQNTLITIGMVAATAITAGIYQSSEISATQYRVLVESFPNVHSPLKQHIKQSFSDGKISRWKYADLFRELMDELHGIALIPSDDLNQEREALKHLVETNG